MHRTSRPAGSNRTQRPSNAVANRGRSDTPISPSQQELGPQELTPAATTNAAPPVHRHRLLFTVLKNATTCSVIVSGWPSSLPAMWSSPWGRTRVTWESVLQLSPRPVACPTVWSAPETSTRHRRAGLAATWSMPAATVPSAAFGATSQAPGCAWRPRSRTSPLSVHGRIWAARSEISSDPLTAAVHTPRAPRTAGSVRATDNAMRPPTLCPNRKCAPVRSSTARLPAEPSTTADSFWLFRAGRCGAAGSSVA